MKSKTANSSSLLLKVPVNINVPVKVLHCYAAYLWFKKINRYGVISKSNLPKEYRSRNNYWLKRLKSVGWIIDHGSYYTLKSYQEIWGLMGVKKCNKKNGHKGYKYVKFVLDKDKSFLKDVKDGVFRHLVDRKKQQIANRLAQGRPAAKARDIRKRGTLVKLSGERAKSLFGYKCFTSGIKYRDKYFKVFKGERFNFLNHKGIECSRYECSSISIF